MLTHGGAGAMCSSHITHVKNDCENNVILFRKGSYWRVSYVWGARGMEGVMHEYSESDSVGLCSILDWVLTL